MRARTISTDNVKVHEIIDVSQKEGKYVNYAKMYEQMLEFDRKMVAIYGAAAVDKMYMKIIEGRN